MAKMRSPNYPAIGLSIAIEVARVLWKKEQRTTVSAEVAAKAMGYKSLNGPARSRLSALKKYGLLQETREGIRLSDLGLRIVHAQELSEDYQDAVSEAALGPALFRELSESHVGASDEALRSHLIVKKHFSEIGARQFIEAFRDTMEAAKLVDKLVDSAYPAGSNGGRAMQNVEQVGRLLGPKQARLFSWPLAKDVSAEVRITGDDVKPAHLERLRQYLELAKAALQSDDGE